MAPLHEFYKLSPQALCRAYLSSAQDDLVTDVDTKVTLDAENFDPGSYFDTVNNRFQAPVAGFYVVTAQVGFKNVVAANSYLAKLFVNATEVAASCAHLTVIATPLVQVSDIVQMAADDYLYLYAVSEAIPDTVDLINTTQATYMAVHLLSAS